MKRYVLALLILLVACGGGSQEQDKYFTGTEGVEMRLPDRNSPPSELYYYDDTSDNSFDVSVEVWNRGSGHAKGGVYLSGYDPDMIHVDGINPQKYTEACGFSLSGLTSGTFRISAGCGTDRISYGDGEFNFQLDRAMDELVKGLNLDPQRWDSEFKGTISEGDNSYELDIGNVDLEYGARGKMLLAAFAPTDFDRRFGEEYILRGDTPSYPGGDVRVVDWQGEVTDFPPGLDKADQTMLITNCYLYGTHAAPQVCIDPAPRSDQEKACTTTRYSGSEGQGAPVVVTNIEQENTRRRAIFHIDIENRGDGEVWHPGRIEKCNPYNPARVRKKDKNKVMLGIVRVAGDPQPLDCVPERLVRLGREGKGEVTCRYPIQYQQLQSAYQTPLMVELWYGYEETMRRTMAVLQSG